MIVKVKPPWKVNSNQNRVYHTEDCQYVQRAKEELIEKEREKLVDVRECKECAGTAEKKHQGNHVLVTELKKEDTTPEDLGMKPIGER